MSCVLDSSAVLAVIRNEPGADCVLPATPGGLLSAVNLSEVYYKALDHGADIERVRLAIRDLKLVIVPFADEHALIAASIRRETLRRGISFADRACLALGIATELPVITGDRTWLELGVGARVRMFRHVGTE